MNSEQGPEVFVPRRARIAMRGYHGGVVLEGPWRPARAQRVDWRAVGALSFGALWIFIFGVTVGVLCS